MKLLDQLDQKLRTRGSPRSTRKTYGWYVRKYFLFILAKYGRSIHPKELGKETVEQWLTHLACNEHVSPTTQGVALQAVLFLYREILGIELAGIDALRSRKPKRVPVVLNYEELRTIFSRMSGVALLIAKLQAGCGLRIGEAVSLRMKDLDFDREQIAVRAAKGAKDRYTVFPKELHEAVQKQQQSMDALYRDDRRRNLPGVSLPYAFARKSPSAATSWPWFYLFASSNLSSDPDTKVVARHHIHASHINRQMSQAARSARLAKRVTSHAFRHSFATYMLSSGTDIQSLASMMGHSNIQTTMIYLHCSTNSGTVQRSPFAEILASPASVQRQRINGHSIGERQRRLA